MNVLKEMKLRSDFVACHCSFDFAHITFTNSFSIILFSERTICSQH
jgi:hypothetical protein